MFSLHTVPLDINSTVIVNHQTVVPTVYYANHSEVCTVHIHRLFPLLFPVWAALE